MENYIDSYILLTRFIDDMKKNNFLKENGKISLVAPSFGCAFDPYITRLNVAIKNLKDYGFKVDVGPNCYLAKEKTRSNTPSLCAKEIMKAFKSDSDCIISVGGGETMLEILPYINFEEIKNLKHKFFMGFSDNTNLTYTLTTIAGFMTIYGVNAPAFAFDLEYDSKDSLDLLMGKIKKTKGYPNFLLNSQNGFDPVSDPLRKVFYDEKKELKLYPRNKNFNEVGRLLGGCLDCLVNICGTRFDKTKEYLEKYKEDGFIWFLESCDLNSISIERALFQLREAGWFKYVKGFVFGRPLHYKEKVFDEDHYEAIKTIIKPLNVPYIIDADLGHLPPSMPFVTGAKAKITTKKSNIFVEYLDL